MRGIIKQFTTTGKSCPRKAPGRILKLMDREVRLLCQYISKNRHLAVTDLIRWARQSFWKTIFDASMRRYIKRCCYAFYKSRRKSFLAAANKRWCVTWAKSQLSWTPSHWERVLWTDESNLQVSYGNFGRKNIRKMDEANDRSCFNRVFSNPSSVMVWGSIAANWVDN